MNIPLEFLPLSGCPRGLDLSTYFLWEGKPGMQIDHGALCCLWWWGQRCCMISKGVLLWRHQLFLSMLSQGSLWFSAMFSFLGAPTPRCPLPSICSSALGQLRSRAQLGLRKDLEDPQLCFVLGFFFFSFSFPQVLFCSICIFFSKALCEWFLPLAFWNNICYFLVFCDFKSLVTLSILLVGKKPKNWLIFIPQGKTKTL